ncbi:MAG: hypothetical protein IPL61_16670 [Myxococcales bacterium]|nr:hypothetical protein [Myxococcales bacterium]
MIDPRHANRLAVALAATAAAVLTAMVAITAATGVAQEPFEVVRADYAPAIAAGADALRAIIGLDALFLIAYTGFFVLLPRALGVADHPLVRLGVRAMVAVAVLDIVEDHHLLALARMAGAGLPISPAAIELQHVLSQAKFHLSYLALAMIALGLPRADVRDRVFAVMIGLPLPLMGALAWAAPSLEAAIGVARWGAFMTGFGAAIVTLRRGARAAAPAADAAATGARA